MTKQVTLNLTEAEVAALYLALNYHRHGLMKLRGEVEGHGVEGFNAALAENEAVHAALTVAVEAAEKAAKGA